MIESVALIGYGEAGQAFDVDATWRAYDRLPERSKQSSMAEALSDAAIVFSLVTADQALSAAEAVTSHIIPGTLFCDCNSVAPDTKREASRLIEAAGGRYVDVAVMSPVNPARRGVPLLVSGPHAEAGLAALAELGFTNARAVGDEVGRASTIKMLRSVMYKGVEALTAECLIACEKAGVTDEVLGSFGNAKGAGDWASGADYRLDRMMIHGLRRAAEMEESAKTLEALGVDALMTRGTVERQAAIGLLNIKSPPDGLDAKLERLSKA
jgi:3-hydroxyisobutyrate dehydrogenase-like beta-hydroxyacid dehydrogenase